MRCNAASARTLSIFSLASDLDATIDFEPVDYLRLIFQTRGRSHITVGRTKFEVTSKSPGYFLPSRGSATEECPDGCRHLAIRLDAGALRTRLAALCGRPVDGGIDFEQPKDGDQRFLEFVRRPLFAAARELDLVEARFATAMLGDIESSIMTRLLLFATHNRSDFLEAEEAAPGHSQMSKAEEFIAANWNRSIDIEGLASAVGVSARTLLRLFRKAYGETPRSHLRRIRLEKARQFLLSAGEMDSVVAIALRCGFSSLGHFAESYQRKFGELPSETMKSRR